MYCGIQRLIALIATCVHLVTSGQVSSLSAAPVEFALRDRVIYALSSIAIGADDHVIGGQPQAEDTGKVCLQVLGPVTENVVKRVLKQEQLLSATFVSFDLVKGGLRPEFPTRYLFSCRVIFGPGETDFYNYRGRFHFDCEAPWILGTPFRPELHEHFNHAYNADALSAKCIRSSGEGQKSNGGIRAWILALIDDEHSDDGEHHPQTELGAAGEHSAICTNIV